jgi:hypothetical protein
LCIQAAGACRNTLHASILCLLMFASCPADLRKVLAVNANLLTGSANHHD